VFDTHPYAWWLSVSLVSIIVAVPARALVDRTPWPLSTRIGIGFAGAAVGSFGGVMFAGAAHLLGASAFLVAAVFGAVVSVAVQCKLQNGAFDWSDFL
jgi:uncharacterized membrane protein YeaQ/YmgE (transglycosylase-associated protein family)